MGGLEQRELAFNLEIHKVPEKLNEKLDTKCWPNSTALDAKDTKMQGISTVFRSRQQKGQPSVTTMMFKNAHSRLRWL